MTKLIIKHPDGELVMDGVSSMNFINNSLIVKGSYLDDEQDFCTFRFEVEKVESIIIYTDELEISDLN